MLALLPLYPTPILRIHTFHTPRLTLALSRLSAPIETWSTAMRNSAILAFLLLSQLYIDASFAQDKTSNSEAYFVAIGHNENHGARKFFEHTKSSRLNRLKYHENLFVSTYAGWILCEQERTANKDRRDFVSFLSGRLNCEVPEWWTTEMVEHVFAKSVLCGLSDNTGGGQFTESDGITHSKTLTLNEVDDKNIDLSSGGRNFKIQWDREDYWNSGKFSLDDELMGVAFHALEDGRYLFAVADESSVLVCCQNADGKTLWQAIYNSEIQRPIASTGVSSTRAVVEISVSNGKVFVFGGNRYSKFVTGNQLSNGNSLLTFTTNFSSGIIKK